MPKLRHVKAEHCVYFITSCTLNRKKVFKDSKNANIAMESIFFGQGKKRYYLLGFVVMPEHIHLAIVPRDRDVPSIMRDLKRHTSRSINLLNERMGALWQEAYMDIALDKIDAVLQKLNYIEMNPVRAGIVENAEDYPFSSAGKHDLMDLSWLWE
jgi:putative transposase